MVFSGDIKGILYKKFPVIKAIFADPIFPEEFETCVTKKPCYCLISEYILLKELAQFKVILHFCDLLFLFSALHRVSVKLASLIIPRALCSTKKRVNFLRQISLHRSPHQEE